MTRNSFRKLSFILTAVVLSGTLYLSTTYATLAPLTPPPSGGYDAGTNSILDPGCAPTDTDCFVKTITADNGLTATGSNVQLGGTLLQDTLIDQDGNDFSIINGNFSFESGINNLFSIPGIFSTYQDSTTIATMGIGEFGGASEKSPILAHSYDDGTGTTSAAQFFVGGVAGSTYTSSIGWTTNYISPTESYGSEMVNLHRTTYFRNTDSILNLSSDFAIDSNTGITFSFTGSGGEDYTFPRNDGTVGQVLTTNGSGVLSWQNAGGGSGWSLTGNAGTDGGVTNFVGTTDVQDLVLKTNGNEIARFGQSGNVSLGSSFGMNPPPIASGLYSFATGVVTTASGDYSTVLGSASVASGDTSMALGYNIVASSFSELALGAYNTIYTPNNTTSWQTSDRLVTIGNGNGLSGNHNAFTLWKDGSFAYNDDNFQNDNPGTEQNMFYFNYGNHDGLGSAQSKRAIRLGSALSDEWDINSANVGNKSISLGFVNDYDGFPSSIASGQNSITIGDNNTASEQSAIAIGSAAVADGVYSIAIGQGSHASGLTSLAIGYGSNASGNKSNSFGDNAKAFSSNETGLGMYNTSYTPISISTWQAADRLLSIGNGTAIIASDAFTILKNGKTGIGIDNFETTASSALLQVGDSSWSGDMARFQNSAGNCTITNPTGWTCSSDERLKTNINTLSSYGLDSVLALRPVTFDWTHGENPTSTIGFIAQEVQTVIPSIVTTDHESGFLSLNTTQMTPILVKAIQEMNLNITDINNTAVANTWRDALISWFGNVGNGIADIYAKVFHADRVETKELCIDDVCINKEQLQTILSNNQVTPISNTPPVTPFVGDDNLSAGDGNQVPLTDTPSDTGNDLITPPADTPVPADTSTLSE